MQTRYASFINSRPVIYFSFKNCTSSGWPSLIEKLKDELCNEYNRYDDAIKAYLLSNPTKAARINWTIRAILGQDTRTDSLENAIKYLIDMVASYYNKNVMLMIDEYDQPIMSSYEYDYHGEVGDFFSNFYGSAMKGNDSLERALLREYGLELNDAVKLQYDGYVFSGKHMYNPWSTLVYVKRGVLSNYWAKTGSNSFVKRLMKEADQEFWSQFDELVSSREVLVDIALETIYSELDRSTNLWGLLLNAGYVTATDAIREGAVTVRIPNNEVMGEFKIVIASISGIPGTTLRRMFECLSKKEIDKFFGIYETIVISCTSYMGSAENAYHMLFLGMTLYLMDIYTITSNHESGYGRYDIRMESRHSSRPHVMFEFKQGAEKNLIELSKEALQQIHDKKYYTGLTGEVLCIGIAHDKKRCKIAHDTYHSTQ